MARLLRCLVIGIVVVSGTCWMHQFVNCGAARRKYDAAMEVMETRRDEGRTCNVWLDHGGEKWPKVGWLLADLAAPTLQAAQASFSRKAVRGNFVALFMPPETRGIVREGGAQAWLPPWYIQEASVAFYAADCSSECRHGIGQKKGGEVGPAVGWRKETGE